jgi:polar amino acid transport system permease protein
MESPKVNKPDGQPTSVGQSNLTAKQASSSLPADFDAADLVIARRRHPGRWVAAVILIWLVALFVIAIVQNEKISYSTIGEYFFDYRILQGLLASILLTVVLMALAIILGTVIAVMRLSANPAARAFAWFYAWLFRGVPVLVQMIIWFNLAIIFERIVFGLPGTGIIFASWDTNELMTPFVAALLGLGLAEAAYVAEIVRGGLLGIDKGQSEAARALGMGRFQVFRHIVMPQTWRIIVPPIGSEFITMFKVTSLASVVGMTDLLGAAQIISATNYRILELLIVASIWYLALTTVLSVLQYFLERHLGRGYTSTTKRSGASKASLLSRPNPVAEEEKL